MGRNQKERDDMPKKTDALDNYKKRQKAVDEMQVEELKRQSAKDREHDEELVRQRSVDEAHDDKIADLEAKHESTKADIEQLKSDLNSAIEAAGKAENSKKDSEQDAQLGRLQNNLLSEALRVKNLYENFEDETKKIAELYDEIYALKQRNVSQTYRDNVQDIDSKETADKLFENKQTDAKQSADISRNKLKINDNFKYIESVDKRLKENKTSDKITRAVAVVSLIGTIALAVAMIFLHTV